MVGSHGAPSSSLHKELKQFPLAHWTWAVQGSFTPFVACSSASGQVPGERICARKEALQHGAMLCLQLLPRRSRGTP